MESGGSIKGTRKVVESRRLRGNKIRKYHVFLPSNLIASAIVASVHSI